MAVLENDRMETDEVNPEEIGEKLVQEDTTYEGKPNEQVEGDDVTPKADPNLNEYGKAFYSSDEMRSLRFEDLDTSRIAPEHQPIYKSLQASYTRSQQDLADQKRMNEARFNQMQQQAQMALDPKEVYFKRYLTDPMRVTNEINETINSLRDADQFDARIHQLQSVKEEFMNRALMMQSQQTAVSAHQAGARNYIYQNVPNYDAKKQDLKTMAIQNGLSSEYADALIDNPAQFGAGGVQMVVALSRLHDKLNVGNVAQTRERKPNPPRTQSPSDARSETGKVNRNVQALFDKAKDTGDWTEYFDAIGLLK